VNSETSPPRGRSRWDDRRERGSRVALRLAVWGIRKIGHERLRILLTPIATYYFLFDGSARRASRDYLSRLSKLQGDREPRKVGDVYRHIYSFAEVILDRLSLWSGSIDEFEIAIHGRKHLETLFESGEGALLMGAHLGNFDLLRLVAREASVPVNVVMYSANAERINAAFEVLDPGCNIRVINFDPRSVNTVFEIRSCLARGEFVAVLADRSPPDAGRRVAHASFLGDRAPFPKGPSLLPILLRVPAILTIAIRTGPRTYEVYFEPLSDDEPITAKNRTRVVQDRVELFASRLEHYCKKAPLQWFNFYDFWSEVDDARR